MAAPQIRFLIRADGAPEAVAALRTIREEEQRLAQAERETAAASRRGNAERKSGLQSLLNTAMSVKGLIAGALVGGMIAFGKSLFDASVQADSLRRGLAAVMPVGADLNAELKRLEQTAKLPGLGLRESIQLSTNLQASGMSADKARAAIEAFGNALATVGKGKAELQGVGLALTQIQAKGKVSAEEINQLAERVPQIRRIMEQAFGTSNTEVLQKANIDAKEFVDTIVNDLNKLPKVTGGMQNSVENLEDSWWKLKKTVGDQVAPSIVSAIDSVNKALEWHDGQVSKTIAQYVKWQVTGGLVGSMYRTLKGLITETGEEAETNAKRLKKFHDQISATPAISGMPKLKGYTGKITSGDLRQDLAPTVAQLGAGDANKETAEQDKLRKLLRIGHKKDRDELLAEEMKLYKKQLEMAGNNAELRREVEKQHQQRLADLNKMGAKKTVRDWADEILSGMKNAAIARADAERTIQEELLRTQEDAAKRQYEIGALSVDEYYRGRRERLGKEQAAGVARLSGRYGATIGTAGVSLSGDELLDAARSSKASLEAQSMSGTKGAAGEAQVERLRKIAELEKLIAEIVKEQEKAKREVAELDQQRSQDNNRIAAEKAQAALDAAEKAQAAEEEKYTRGEQSRLETDRNINALGMGSLPELQALSAAMTQSAIGPEQVRAANEFADAIAKWGQAAAETNVAMIELKTTVAGMMVQGLTQFWMDIASAQLSVGDAALKMAQNFVTAMLQMVTEAIMTKIVFTAMGLPMPGGSLASMFSTGGAVQKKAAGGAIYGPGTGTSDSIPALLSNGEHVLTAAEVRAAGGQEAIYSLRAAIRSGARFAEGGAVGDVAGVALMNGSSNASLEVGLQEGLVARIVDEHLSGPGMKTIINTIPKVKKAFTNAQR